MDLVLKSKNALIVGDSKGIGGGIILGFAEENCKIVNITRSEDLLKEVGQKALEARRIILV